MKSRGILGVVVMCIGLIGFQSVASANLTAEIKSWHIIGLDSNKPTTEGPNQFLVQIRIANNSTTVATDVTAAFSWTTANDYINLASTQPTSQNIGNISAGAFK
ncbi:MAG: hypothetical protein AB1756_06950 [Acidobacteriota bacterium]